MEAEHAFFEIPTKCPICFSDLTIQGDFLFCKNRACPNQLTGSVKVWIKRLGILQWGDALIERLTDPADPKIFQIGDIYRLTIPMLATCCSGEKVATKLYNVLHKHKRLSIELFLASLNIPNLALATAQDIVQAGFDSIEKIMDLTYDDLLKVENIGAKTARTIFDGLQEKRVMIFDLNEVVQIRGPVVGPLSGMSFCITGDTKKPRNGIHGVILDHGGVVKESVGKGLTYLVCNETSTSSKSLKAQKYGTKIITEDQLYEMMGWSPKADVCDHDEDEHPAVKSPIVPAEPQAGPQQYDE